MTRLKTCSCARARCFLCEIWQWVSLTQRVMGINVVCVGSVSGERGGLGVCMCFYMKRLAVCSSRAATLLKSNLSWQYLVCVCVCVVCSVVVSTWRNRSSSTYCMNNLHHLLHVGRRYFPKSWRNLNAAKSANYKQTRVLSAWTQYVSIMALIFFSAVQPFFFLESPHPF